MPERLKEEREFYDALTDLIDNFSDKYPDFSSYQFIGLLEDIKFQLLDGAIDGK